MKKLFYFMKNNLLLLFLATVFLWLISTAILEQFIWKIGLHFHSNTISSFFFLILFLVLPTFIIEKIYKNKFQDTKETTYQQKCNSVKDVGKILMSGIFKFGLVILLPIALLILSSSLCVMYLKDELPMENPYILYSHFQYLPLFSGIGLFVLLIWLFSKKGLAVRSFSPSEKTDFFSEGEKAHLPFSIKCRIALISTLIFLLTLFTPACSYDFISQDGVIRHIFFYEKTYTWKDVSYYSLRLENKGSVIFVLEMNDRTTIFWNTCLSSNLPEKQYPNEFYDFSIYLADKLHKQGVPFQMKNWDKFYEKLEFSEDIEFSQKIKEISKRK